MVWKTFPSFSRLLLSMLTRMWWLQSSSLLPLHRFRLFLLIACDLKTIRFGLPIRVMLASFGPPSPFSLMVYSCTQAFSMQDSRTMLLTSLLALFSHRYPPSGTINWITQNLLHDGTQVLILFMKNGK